MKRTLIWIARIATGVLALIGAFVLIVGLMFDGASDYVHGRIQRIAEQSHDDVDRIEIYLLQAPEGTKAVETFRVTDGDRDYRVYGTATLEGDDAKQAAELWTYTLKAAKLQAMCHAPPYGVRMYAGDVLRFETSICWSCSNFQVQALPRFSSYYGFAADSKSAKELLALFDSKLPYPRHEAVGGKKDSESDE